MGQVYKVIIPDSGTLAALKLLKPSQTLINKMGARWLLDQFIHEATIIANIHHPNIVTVLALEKEHQTPFYLMEYFCRNLGTLIGETYWADRPSRIVTLKKAVAYCIESLKGLSALHKEGIIHRDIKPFNMMLTDTGSIKIADFGLSKRRGEASNHPKDITIGTPFYTSPEQIKNPEKADHRSDLYSVGVMLYRMLTGVLPQEKRQLPSHFNPDLDDNWDSCILKFIDPKPEHRFQTAASMIDELETLYQKTQQKKEMDCRILEKDLLTNGKEKSLPPAILRSKPGRILVKHARSVFEIDAFNRPRVYFENRFEKKSSKIIIDESTHLAWQQSGSSLPVNFNDAHTFIEQLNMLKPGGYSHWRLPTVNEILSVLTPPPPGEDFCFDSPFSAVQKWIWTGDTRSRRAAWVVDMEMGFVTSSDIVDTYFVKGVCTI